MSNLRLKKQILEVVNNQIRVNDPPCTKRTFLQLQEQGCTKSEAREMIAAVLLGEMYDVLSKEKSFDEKKYEKELMELVKDEFVFENYRQALEDDSDVILQTKYKVYDAILAHRTSEATRLFMEIWDDLKKFVIDGFYGKDDNGKLIKPELIEVDDQTDFKYELFNWLQDMEMEFHNSRMYDERIRFCQDVIELFAWKADSADNYMAGIGEALNDLRRYKECDVWFENWLAKEPDNVQCVNIYIFCAFRRGDLEKAKQLTEKLICASIEFNIENQILYYRAIEVYEALNDSEKIKLYTEKMDKYRASFENNMKSFDVESQNPVFYNEPITKEKKVYPNDPCPCGSGKKYKKCCCK